MHNKYAKDGLAAVSVDLDNPDPKIRKRVIEFLKEKKATLTNVVLAEGEKADDWFDHLKLVDDAVPSVFVYNRQGELEKKLGGEEYEEVEPLVAELLKKK